MTTIRPPGGPSLPAGIDPTSASSVGAPAAGGEAAAVRAPAHATAAQSVIADLQAARIGPDEAVRRLTSIAAQGAPASVRPAVEARIRAALARDPLVGALLRRMGASVPED